LLRSFLCFGENPLHVSRGIFINWSLEMLMPLFLKGVSYAVLRNPWSGCEGTQGEGILLLRQLPKSTLVTGIYIRFYNSWLTLESLSTSIYHISTYYWLIIFVKCN
jgi:hypothetical protein